MSGAGAPADDAYDRTVKLANRLGRPEEEDDEDEDDSDEEDDYDEEEPSGAAGQKADGQQGLVLAPPKPLFYERGDTEWDDLIEELPRTGTTVNLRHPPPQFINTNLESEALAPDVPDELIDEKSSSDKIMGKQPRVSTNGYPHLSQNQRNVVYDSVQLNARRSVNKAAANKPFYELKNESDTTLVFDSLFESGNLYQAHQSGPDTYDLVLKNDYNTNGHTQWYYFAVSNVRKGVTYKFRIINFYKRSSMYNRGLRPLLYSEKKEKEKALGWHRAGSDVLYKRNEYQYTKPNSTFVRSFYSLQFSIQFPHDDDTCYLAHCYPYTYSDLMTHLTRLEADADIRKMCRRRLMCRTIANNRCDVLTITAPRTEAELAADDNKEDLTTKKKPCIVISARVHPGETNASWMMKGCIDYLTGPSEGAQRLRQKFVFKIVPMLNPDGVIVGNYRTGLAGTDLNRKWKSPDEDLHPTIFHMKSMMERMRDERSIVLYVDLHGHSVKKNCFIYGCDAKFFDTAENHPSRETPQEMENRIFPAMLANKCAMFNFQDCRFHVRKRKETSGRVVAWRQFTNNSFTLEASFGGADEEHRPPNQHFTINTYEQIGIDLCHTIEDVLCVPDEEKETMRAALLAQISEVALPEGDSDDEGDGAEGRESSDDGSDSDTVENVVLPSRVEKVRKAKIQAKKKKPKAPPKPTKREDKSPERPAKPVAAKEPKKEPTPRDERPKSPLRQEPKSEPPKPETKPETSDLGTSRCNCPSCQAYEEFIASSLPNFNSGPASGSPSGRRRAASDAVRGSPGPMAQRGTAADASQPGGGGGGGGDDAQDASTPSDSRRPGPSASSQSAGSRSSNSSGSHRRG